jgi:hypothetical protein
MILGIINLTHRIFGSYITPSIGAMLLFSGCSSVPIKADCYKFKYYNYNVIACEDSSVNKFCHKICKTNDNGTPMTDRIIPACYDGRLVRISLRPTIILAKSYLGCLPHELCHLEGRPAIECENKYPCIGRGY